MIFYPQAPTPEQLRQREEFALAMAAYLDRVAAGTQPPADVAPRNWTGD